MVIHVLLIPADNDNAVTMIGTEATLDAFQEIVGGLIEVVTLSEVGRHSLYFNEEGKLLHLPFNSRATWLLHKGTNSVLDVIVGDAFLAGPVDDDGNDTNVGLAVMQSVPGL